LVAVHGEMVYRFLRLRLGNDADAKDALQETLSSAWGGMRTLRDPISVRAWLLTIAVRHAAGIISRSQRQAGLQALPAPVADHESALDLQFALDALPPERRDVVLLRYLVGLSETETAAVLDINVGTVKSRAARARQAMATHLQIGEEYQ
jgi:RNA polymerase sigma-70 factor (ECF subfamily)